MKNRDTAWQFSLKIFKWTAIFIFFNTIWITFGSTRFNPYFQSILLFSFTILLFIYKLEDKRVAIYTKFHTWYNSLSLSRNFFIVKLMNFFKAYSFVGILAFLLSLKAMFLSLLFILLAQYFEFSSNVNGFISILIYLLLYVTLVFAFAVKSVEHNKKETFANLSFIAIFISLTILNLSNLSLTFFSIKEKVESSSFIELERCLNLKLYNKVRDVEELDVYSDFFMGPVYEKYGYKASADFFTFLSKHDNYPRKDYKNTPIHKVSCADFRNNTFFNTVTKNSECYFGVIYPYYHNIVYNPKSEEVEDVVGYYYW